MIQLPEAFVSRMKERLGEQFPAFAASYEKPPVKGLRVNPLKISAEAFAKISPFPLEPVPWETDGFYITEEKAGGDVYHFAGLYYLQEPSAMCAAPLLAAAPGERVLDLCAAPGGKTTQLAAAMRGKGVLVANEIDFSRAKILSQNVERLGIVNCIVTCMSPSALAERLPEYFDKVLVDAPCSGEGMFKKEPNAIPEWSEANVARCAVRQRAILDEAAKLLAGGGKLVYSTCTFSEEEDEGQVGDFLRRHPEFTLLGEKKLYPHAVEGEGHFAALLVKTEGTRRGAKPLALQKNRAVGEALGDFAAQELPLYAHSFDNGNKYRYFSPPEGAPALPALRPGLELGEYDGKLFKPAHALAMAYGGKARRKIILSREEAERYLRGETLETDQADGWCAVCAEEFPLGLGKIVGGTVKNHLPKGLRKMS